MANPSAEPPMLSASVPSLLRTSTPIATRRPYLLYAALIGAIALSAFLLTELLRTDHNGKTAPQGGGGLPAVGGNSGAEQEEGDSQALASQPLRSADPPLDRTSATPKGHSAPASPSTEPRSNARPRPARPHPHSDPPAELTTVHAKSTPAPDEGTERKRLQQRLLGLKTRIEDPAEELELNRMLSLLLEGGSLSPADLEALQKLEEH